MYTVYIARATGRLIGVGGKMGPGRKLAGLAPYPQPDTTRSTPASNQWFAVSLFCIPKISDLRHAPNAYLLDAIVYYRLYLKIRNTFSNESHVGIRTCVSCFLA